MCRTQRPEAALWFIKSEVSVQYRGVSPDSLPVELQWRDRDTKREFCNKKSVTLKDTQLICVICVPITYVGSSLGRDLLMSGTSRRNDSSKKNLFHCTYRRLTRETVLKKHQSVL